MVELFESWDSTVQPTQPPVQKLALPAGDPTTVSARPLQAGKGAEVEGRHYAKPIFVRSQYSPSVLQAGKGAELQGCHNAKLVCWRPGK